MRALVQRVTQASVRIDGEIVGGIQTGLLVLVGVGLEDTAKHAVACARKVRYLRVFPQEGSQMDRDVCDVGGAILVVSQFTLMANTSKGRRPSFSGAAPGEVAEPLVAAFRRELEVLGAKTEGGVFGEYMLVSLTNDGPVTLLIEV